MSPLDEAYRKAALLFTMLDREAVELLLPHLEREQIVRLQQVLGELPASGPQERGQAIREFLQATAGDAAFPRDADGVEIDASLAARIASEETAPTDRDAAEDAPEDAPFAFLADVAPHVLADLLHAEHAQTIRIVLTYLPENTVAEILPRLTRQRRQQVLQRWEQSEPIDEAVVAMVERELERLFSRQLPGGPPAPADTEVVPAIARGTRPPGTAGAPVVEHAPATVPARQESQLATPHGVPRPAFEFDDLNALDEASLARVFRGAEPQAALVALAAASPALVDRIRRQLSWREARNLKQQLERLGPIRLSDVESAQQQLADVASELIQQGAIVPPQNRRFMVAA